MIKKRKMTNNSWNEYEKFVLEKFDNIVEDIKELKEDTKSIKNSLNELPQKYYDGCPLKKDNEDYETRIKSLEKFNWKLTGAFTFIVIVSLIVLKII